MSDKLQFVDMSQDADKLKFVGHLRHAPRVKSRVSFAEGDVYDDWIVVGKQRSFVRETTKRLSIHARDASPFVGNFSSFERPNPAPGQPGGPPLQVNTFARYRFAKGTSDRRGHENSLFRATVSNFFIFIAQSNQIAKDRSKALRVSFRFW